MTSATGTAVEIKDVSVIRGGVALLDGVSWHIGTGERWVLLGPNGSGKTTLVSIVATYLWPSRGTVTILGQTIGEVDVRKLRRKIGVVSASLETRIPPELTATDLVVAGSTGAIAPWWDDFGPAVRTKAAEMLELVGCSMLADRRFDLLSSGERQRVQIARALMLDPALLLLDEPAAGLDLGAREQLALILARLNAQTSLAGVVVVTHHVEEIARGTTHALVLRGGRVVAAGVVGDTVSGAVLSEAFAMPIRVERVGGRFVAQAEDRA